jgi:SAM-dependent methyltransferase
MLAPKFMNDPLSRFSTRVENYVKYRPSYPAGVIDVLKSDCGFKEDSIIADIGSGTGVLSKLFLSNGNTVFGVEPNAAMRTAGERLLKPFGKFISIDATAEATTLESDSAAFITAGQAFHWFDREKAKLEFARILKPEGYIVLIWNERRLDSTPFLRAYEDLLLGYGTDYEKVRHENVTDEIAEFFAPETFRLKSLENSQAFNFEALRGRVCSSSYMPEPGSANFEPMLAQLQEIFDANNREGTVILEYDTRVYYGHLRAS